MITQQDIPTFVINLKRRPDRLEHARKQLEYIGWQYEVFDAIDTDSYVGCGKSHTAIAEIAYKNNFNQVLVLEDDIFFMPYAKEFWQYCLIELSKIDWTMFNVTPTIHRPILNYNKYLMDITNLPVNPKDHYQAKVFGTTGLLYTNSVYEKILEWETVPSGHPGPLAFDDYLATHVYPTVLSFCPTYPIITQYHSYSDINQNDLVNAHYTMTYNWNVYTENKLPGNLTDLEYCKNIRSSFNIEELNL